MLINEVVAEARESIRSQIINAVDKDGGSTNEYFVRFTTVDQLGFSAKQTFGRSPDVGDANFSIDYIGAGKGHPALWFYPLKSYLTSQDLYAAEHPYIWLVRLKPTAWLQPVTDKTTEKQPAPRGKQRVGLLRLTTVPAAIFFQPGFDLVGKFYNHGGQHQRHGQVKGAPAPTFFDRVRGNKY